MTVDDARTLLAVAEQYRDAGRSLPTHVRGELQEIAVDDEQPHGHRCDARRLLQATEEA